MTDLEAFKAMLDRAGVEYEERKERDGRADVVVTTGGAWTHVVFGPDGELVGMATGY